MPETKHTPASEKVAQVVTPSEEAGLASRTAKSPTQDWTSQVPDGGWGWLVVGGSFILAVSGDHRQGLLSGPLWRLCDSVAVGDQATSYRLPAVPCHALTAVNVGGKYL